MNPIDGVRHAIRRMAGYRPGEQPRGGNALKLNTNENPYPPSPAVAEAVAEVLRSDRLRKYPDPSSLAFRRTAAEVLGVDSEGVIAGNGSDDILTILVRTFVPEGGLIVSLTPSYILYKSLAEIQGARFEAVPFNDDWTLPEPFPIRKADLVFVANPNSPSGTTVAPEAIRRLCHEIDVPVVVDEAYGDFAPDHCLGLVREGVIVTRSFSKSYSLAGLRFGFAVADPAIVDEMNKVKDSYNVDLLAQVAATAALADQAYFISTRDRIIETRGRLTTAMRQRGFDVTDSHANFVWCRRERPVQPIYERLKERGILIRYMNYAGHGDGLRVTVGTDAEVVRFLAALDILLDEEGR